MVKRRRLLEDTQPYDAAACFELDEFLMSGGGSVFTESALPASHEDLLTSKWGVPQGAPATSPCPNVCLAQALRHGAACVSHL
jgi:hypothetical protein